MDDLRKTKKQLIEELEALRAELSELKGLPASGYGNYDRQLYHRLERAMDSAQIGIWELDVVNDRLIWNERMFEIYGVEPSCFLGVYQSWEQSVHPDDVGAIQAHLQQALRGETDFNCEFRIVGAGGTIRSLKANAIVERNAQGEPQRVIGLNYDISDRKQAERALELQAVITRNMAEGICLVRADNAMIVYANPKFEQMFGYKRGELDGQHVSIVNYSDGKVTAEDVNQTIRATVLEQGEHTYEVQNVKKDGTPFWCTATTSVFNHPEYGAVLVAVHQDITARKKAEERLEQLNRELEQRILARTVELTQANRQLQEELAEKERLQRELLRREKLLQGFFEAASAANIGLCIHDRDLSYLQINQTLADIHGLPIEAHLGKTCSEIIPNIATTLIPMLQSVVSTGQAIDKLEVSGTMPSQPDLFRHWLFSFFPIFAEKEQVSAVGKIVLEITDRKHDEEAMYRINQQLEERLEELRQRNQEMLLLGELSDFLQSCLTVEEACVAITTLAKPLFPHCAVSIFTIANSRNYLELVSYWGELSCSNQVFPPDHCWALRRGRSHWVTPEQRGLLCNHTNCQHSSVESLCIPMIAQGETLGLLQLCAFGAGCLTESRQQLARNVAEQLSLAIANLNLRTTLQAQSIRDPLTGLFNRRYLEEFLHQEIHRAERNQYSVGVIMIDIDHFRHFNNTLGHDGGDFILKEIAQLLKNEIRQSDVACRYGGEEMLLILPETSLEIAQERAELIRRAIAELRLTYNDIPVASVTASLGVACFPTQGETASSVIKAADVALYQAKAAGRNQVVVGTKL